MRKKCPHKWPSECGLLLLLLVVAAGEGGDLWKVIYLCIYIYVVIILCGKDMPHELYRCFKDRQQSSGQISQLVCIFLIQSLILNGILNNETLIENYVFKEHNDSIQF